LRFNKTLSTSVFILLSIAVLSPLTRCENLPACKIDGVPRIKQLHNYCGPAAMTSVLQFNGEKITQEDVGKAVFDTVGCATNGADMLFYARNKGYAAYSWNSSIADAKRKLGAGAPVLVLQYNSLRDTSGHYRVLTGYDDAKSKFYVMDPYYDDITELSYAQCERLWRPMGYWAMVIVPAAKDTFANDLGAKNPVVHMDLSYALYKHGDYTSAMKEAKIALSLEPGNNYARSMVTKINTAMGPGKKG
jgi:uncharacterized protein YvpB